MSPEPCFEQDTDNTDQVARESDLVLDRLELEETQSPVDVPDVSKLEQVKVLLESLQPSVRVEDAFDDALATVQHVIHLFSQRAALQRLRSQAAHESGATTNELKANGVAVRKMKRHHRVKAHCCHHMTIFIALPLAIVLPCVLCGALMAMAERWSFPQGFFYVHAITVGMCNPIMFASLTPQTTLGGFIALIIAFWALALCGIVLGIVRESGMTATLERYITSWSGRQPCQRLVGVLFVTMVFVPALMLSIGALLGLLLSLLEGWTALDGILYMLGNAAGLPGPLVSVEANTDAGAILDTWWSIIMFIFASNLIGLAQAQVATLGELMSLVRRRCVRTVTIKAQKYSHTRSRTADFSEV